MGKHGTPDWGIRAPKSTLYGGIDLAEHAARLGSPVTFDRRGDVIWYDDFEHGVEKWVLRGAVLGHSREWSALYSANKGFSCQLYMPANAAAWAGIQHLLPFPVLSRVGAEVSLSLNNDNTTLMFSLLFYDGAYMNTAQIRWGVIANTFEYLGADAAYHALSPTKLLKLSHSLFHNFKMVTDMVSKEYVRFICNNEGYTLPALGIRRVANGTSPFMWINIDAFNDEAVAKYVYIDDVIVTQNEP